MQPDDVYPGDSTYFNPFDEPSEQKNERRKEVAQKLDRDGVINKLLQRLEKRIEFYGTVDSMPDECKTDAVKLMTMHNANQIARDNLRAEKEWIESLLK